MDYRFEDFTEDAYRGLLRATRARYSFEPFGTSSVAPHVLWRHDVDYSVHRALRLAELEAEEGVRSTFFLLLHSEMYNLLELGVFERARRILELGHWLGVHFDAGFYGGQASEETVAEKLSWERRLFADLFGVEPDVFSLHNTQVSDSARFDADALGGMVNATGRGLRDRYVYVSDSNGYWRHQPIAEVILAAHERVQVLTHPEWWQVEAMSPRDRIDRCIRGRARFMGEAYDQLLANYGRVNVRGSS